MHAAGGMLLARAQEVGLVRPDVTAEDLFTAITSAAWARENSPPGHDHSERLIELLMDGLRR
jgi:hypothetical protein